MYSKWYGTYFRYSSWEEVSLGKPEQSPGRDKGVSQDGFGGQHSRRKKRPSGNRIPWNGKEATVSEKCVGARELWKPYKDLGFRLDGWELLEVLGRAGDSVGLYRITPSGCRTKPRMQKEGDRSLLWNLGNGMRVLTQFMTVTVAMLKAWWILSICWSNQVKTHERKNSQGTFYFIIMPAYMYL